MDRKQQEDELYHDFVTAYANLHRVRSRYKLLVMYVDKNGEYKNRRVESKIDIDDDDRVNKILDGGFRKGIKYRTVILHIIRGGVVSDYFYLDNDAINTLNTLGAEELFKND